MVFERVQPGVWLIATTAFIVACLLSATLVVTLGADRIATMADEVSYNGHASIQRLSSMRTELHAIDDVIATSFLEGESADTLRASLAEHRKRLRATIAAYEALPYFPTERERWESTYEAIEHAEEESTTVVARLDAGDRAGARVARDTSLADAIRGADESLHELTAFDTDQATRLGQEIRLAANRSRRALIIFDATASVLGAALLLIGARATHAHVAALRHARDVEASMQQKLGMVATGAITISERIRLGRDRVLQATVDAACAVTGASICGIGVGTRADVPFEPFVQRGVDGREPRPEGLVGAAIRQDATIVVNDASSEAPLGSQVVSSFLAVPLRREREVVGEIFLAKPPGASPFTSQDARAVELLAALVVTASENETLYGSLKQAIRTREDLLSMVSHDLRNPLSAISMSAALMKQSAPEGPLRAQADIVTRNAKRMDRMIADLLTASKLREGKLAIEPSVTDVGALLSEAVQTFAEAARQKGVALEVEPGDVPPAFCDAARIAQVLANLVGNALKFTRAGDSIALSARAAENEIVVCVRDTGVGIAPDAAAHVFERYWQSQEHAARGTGLGLFIVRGIVDSHRGRVWVESELGRGSSFYFTLPVAGDGGSRTAALRASS